MAEQDESVLSVFYKTCTYPHDGAGPGDTMWLVKSGLFTSLPTWTFLRHIGMRDGMPTHEWSASTSKDCGLKLGMATLGPSAPSTTPAVVSRLSGEIAPQPSPWSRTPPTESGWYWAVHDYADAPEPVRWQEGVYYRGALDGGSDYLAMVQWWGPRIEPPVPPKP